ncbi:MAG: hypothetical protein CL913_08205 [Deltaproteobacteria bacterium]|nr:hypothetical protein [Deltaproteobacteria bacterium]
MQKHHHVLHDRVEPAALDSPSQVGDWDTGTASAEDVTNQPEQSASARECHHYLPAATGIHERVLPASSEG